MTEGRIRNLIINVPPGMRPPLIRGGNLGEDAFLIVGDPASMRPPLIRGGNFAAVSRSRAKAACFNEAAPNQGRKFAK